MIKPILEPVRKISKTGDFTLTATKVIIVSTEDVHAYMHSLYHNPNANGGWDIQPHVSSVGTFWDGLQSGHLPSDSEIVIFNDLCMVQGDESEYKQLVSALSQLSEHAMIMVLFYDYDNNFARLESDVAETARAEGADLYRFYPINTQEPDMNHEIGTAWDAYYNQPRMIASADQLRSYGVPQAPAAPVGFQSQQSYAEPVYETPEPVYAEAPKRGKILISTSSKGGSGKTTVALCTATMLYYASKRAAEEGLREKPLKIVLVDLDIRDGQIGLNIGITVPTALNILIDDSNDNGKPSQNTIKENLVEAKSLGIWTLLAPKRPRTAAHLDPGFYKNVITELTEMFDVVILDTSVNYMDKLLGSVALPMADNIMFVADLSAGAVFGMTRWIDEVTTPPEKGGPGIEIDRIGVIINKSARNLGVDSEILAEAANGAEIVCAIPLDSAAVIAASNNRRLHDIIQMHDLISPAYFEIVKHFFSDEPLLDPLQSSQAAAAAAVQQPAPAQKRKLFGR